MLGIASYVDLFHLYRRESLDKTLTAIKLALRVDDPRTEVANRHWATVALSILGDLQGVRRHASAMLLLGKDENAQQDMDRAEELGMDHEVIQAL